MPLAWCGFVAWGSLQVRAFFVKPENSPPVPITLVTAECIRLAWSDVWWVAGCWQNRAWPCAGKILRLRLKVAGREIASVPKHVSLNLGSVNSTSLG